jgi:hypothetical protein
MTSRLIYESVCYTVSEEELKQRSALYEWGKFEKLYTLYVSVEKLTHLGEKTPKTNPGSPGWRLDIGLATQFRWGSVGGGGDKICYEISVKYSRLE